MNKEYETKPGFFSKENVVRMAKGLALIAVGLIGLRYII
jgi:hypothetical protein